MSYTLTGNSCFFGHGKMSLYQKILKPVASSQSVGKAFRWVMMSWMTSSPLLSATSMETHSLNLARATKWKRCVCFLMMTAYTAPHWSEETPLSYRSRLGIGEWGQSESEADFDAESWVDKPWIRLNTSLCITSFHLKVVEGFTADKVMTCSIIAVCSSTSPSYELSPLTLLILPLQWTVGSYLASVGAISKSNWWTASSKRL